MVKRAQRVMHGIPASPGIGHGKILVYDTRRSAPPRYCVTKDAVQGELDRFERAVEKTRHQLRQTQQMVRDKMDQTHARIFEAQEMLLDDPLLGEACRQQIRDEHLNSEAVLHDVVERIRKLFEQIDVPHLKLQNLDVLDVASRIRENLSGGQVGRFNLEHMAEDCILLAYDLHPSDTARLNRQHILAIVTEVGGPTSHSAILAKALKIPAVVGLEGILERVENGDSAIVDGSSGIVTLRPTRQDMERLRRRRESIREEEETLGRLRELPCETRDGYAVSLLANIEFPGETEFVTESGAQGIGLFRTEFFYIERRKYPSEEEQLGIYRQVVNAMEPDPVVFRTLDLGGDKFMHESELEGGNSQLGLRAIRLCFAQPELFRTQLRAILRASAFGQAHIMLPFITDVSELRQARKLLESYKQELRDEGLEFDENIQLGIMVETPSAALCADQLAREADFFSLGTNDLIQYTLAVDRVDETVADIYNPLHPAVIKLIRNTIDAAHRAGIRVSVCGEMASDPALAVLMMGFGVDELSMSSVALPNVKRLIRSLHLEDVRKLDASVMDHLLDGKAQRILDAFRRKHAPRKK